MVDFTQNLLIIVITTLTALLVIIGIQVFLILKELKKSAELINTILEDAKRVSENILKPVSGFSDFFEGIKGGVKILELILGLFKKGKKDE